MGCCRSAVAANALLAALAVASCSGSPTAPSANASGSLLKFSSEPGDWIGQGESRHYTTTNARFRAVMDLDRHHLHVTVDPPDPAEDWTLHIAAPQGEQLVRRTYERAIAWPSHFPTAPGFALWGSGRGCGPLDARFVVRELEYGSLGEVAKLDMIFEQTCRGATSALTGELRIVDGGAR